MTNRELITAALRMLTVLDADQTAMNPEDGQLGLDELNTLMATLATQGIDLGFPPQDNLSDDFPLDDQVAAQIKPVLAMHLFTFYPSANVPQTLPASAERSMSRLLLDSVLASMQEASMRNLPLGEARRCRY